MTSTLVVFVALACVSLLAFAHGTDCGNRAGSASDLHSVVPEVFASTAWTPWEQARLPRSMLSSCSSRVSRNSNHNNWAFPTMLRVSFLPALAHHFVSPRQRRHKYPQISSDVTHSRVVCISWMCVGRVWGRAWIPATVQAARISLGAMPRSISTGSA